jgi:HAD superfamily phosphoserine phosphatase-like hydrolase
VLAVFVDYDGTITDRDTFNVLVHACAGAHVWERLERRLAEGTMTLRDVLAEQASYVRLSLEEAEAAIAREARIEPSFPAFVDACERAGAELTILSGGVATLIGRALAREGLARVAYEANDADFSLEGWRMTFRDESDRGHDKARAVRAAAARGLRTAFIGDGISDFDAALAADLRFAKRGHALERFLRERGAPYASFSDFAEVERALFTKG